MPADFTLTPEERKHLAIHLMAPSYPLKEDAELTVSLLLRLGYKAELEEELFGNETEWTAHCAELEVPV